MKTFGYEYPLKGSILLAGPFHIHLRHRRENYAISIVAFFGHLIGNFLFLGQ
jgi:hypothetical protein